MDRARYRRDQVKRLEAVRKYREENRDEINARARKRAAENPGHFKELARRSYQNHREQRIQDALKWQKQNPDRVAVRHAKRKARESGYRVAPAFQTRALERYRRCCAYCGVKLDLSDRKTPTGLHWDHVIPLSRGGRNTEGNLLPTCSRCNLGKGANFLMEFRAGRKGDKVTDLLKARQYLEWLIERESGE